MALAGIGLAVAIACAAPGTQPTSPSVPGTASAPTSTGITPLPTSIGVSPLPSSVGLSPLPTNVTQVTVSLIEWKVAMDKSTVSSGPVRFVVKNDGTTTHALEVAGQGLDKKTPFLSPGETANLDMQLPPGQYEAWCPVNNHRANGMTTTFAAK